MDGKRSRRRDSASKKGQPTFSTLNHYPSPLRRTKPPRPTSYMTDRQQSFRMGPPSNNRVPPQVSQRWPNFNAVPPPQVDRPALQLARSGPQHDPATS
ncbi:unnamed protein product [Linum trigynum]|uniref:Uncharacterized protein n=1 Tax=Linum trigynum TaxID=586398 RepID=A0AAV2E1U2_9ROSI